MDRREFVVGTAGLAALPFLPKLAGASTLNKDYLRVAKQTLPTDEIGKARAVEIVYTWFNRQNKYQCEYIPARMIDIKKGQHFFILEPETGYMKYEYVASEDAYKDESGVVGVESERHGIMVVKG